MKNNQEKSGSVKNNLQINKPKNNQEQSRTIKKHKDTNIRKQQIKNNNEN